MSGFLGIGGGGFNLISMVSQAAMAAVTGGTSLIATMAMQIAEQVAKQVIQQVGQQLGLPQSAISAAIAAFDAATGNVGAAAGDVTGAVENAAQQLNMSPTDSGQLHQAASTFGQNLYTDSMAAADSTDNSSAPNSKDGFLVALGKALGQAMDKKMDRALKLTTDMNNLSGQLSTGTNPSDQASNTKVQSQLGVKSGELQGVTQELSILSQALANTLKTLGEAQSTLARKG